MFIIIFGIFLGYKAISEACGHTVEDEYFFSLLIALIFLRQWIIEQKIDDLRDKYKEK